MSELFRLHGFAFPTVSGNTFSTPIFSNEDSYFVQVIDEQDQIVDFEAVDSRSMNCQESSEVVYYKRGDWAIYAVRDQFNYLTVENGLNIRSYLRSKIKSYVTTPFFYKAVSEFCNEGLAEYAGCISSKDYLLRQVLSSFARSYRFGPRINYYEIKERHVEKVDHYLPTAKLNRNFGKVSKGQNYSSVREYEHWFQVYNDFIQKAALKHKNIAKEKVVQDSLNLGANVLPRHISQGASDTVQSYLIMLIRNHAHAKRLPNKPGDFSNWYCIGADEAAHKRSVTTELASVLSDQSKLPALSLMLFVYTMARELKNSES